MTENCESGGMFWKDSFRRLPTLVTKHNGYNHVERQYCSLVGRIMRKCMFSVLSVGPIPTHIAIIMDGNRRYARRCGMEDGEGHKAGFSNLLHILRYCYEMGVKYVTVYAFSIDNFNRRPEEVQCLMDLMLEKIDELLKEGSILQRFGIRLYFIGNLKLLHERVRMAAEKAMKITAENKKVVLLVCVAYTSCDEITNAVAKSCSEKIHEVQKINGIKMNGLADSPGNVSVVDIERNMYMSMVPDPDLVIRSSGETRLSNFLLWQTGNSPLYYPRALWPDFGLRDLVWTVLNYQRSYSYLQKQVKNS